MSKKKKKGKKNSAESAADLEAEVRRLRDENVRLREKLEKIRGIAADVLGRDEEDEEYDELTRDVDDLIEDGRAGEDTGNLVLP